MKNFKILVLLCVCLSVQLFGQETFRIVTYNALKFPENYAQVRIPYFRTVIQELDPDILVIQELTSKDGVNLFLNEILNKNEQFLYTAAPFENGFDTDNMLFFKSREFSIISNRQIKTSLRDISEYVLRVRANDSMPNIRVYSLHLKASSGTSEEQQRYRDAVTLRTELDHLAEDTNFFVVGDFNIYSNSEQAFKTLIADNGNPGQCFDPINKMGQWHNNKTYAKYHTQSTRTSKLYDGSSGGMDDRFDFILVSSALLDESDFFCLTDTYKAFGNDGFHFNANINDGTNTAVSKTVANALYHASDHLPVTLDVVWNDPTHVDENEILPQEFHLCNYPNPFNHQTRIEFTLPQSDVVYLSVYNTNGQLVEEWGGQLMEAGTHSVQWNASLFNSGLYLFKMQTSSHTEFGKMLYIK